MRLKAAQVCHKHFWYERSSTCYQPSNRALTHFLAPKVAWQTCAYNLRSLVLNV